MLTQPFFQRMPPLRLTASDLEVSGVLGLGETIGVGLGGGCVDLGR